MAGFIFSIDSSSGVEGLKKCIYDGDYSAIVPMDLSVLKTKQIVASVLADYCSMKEGDNVYFLSKRCIYGVGKLVNIQEDCKYKNYLRASVFEKIDLLEEKDYPLKLNDPCARWICFFSPEHKEGFFANGIDMDDVLQYKPSSFKMLRAFKDRSFIKIDDEENEALKQFIYLRNKDSREFYSFSDAEHKRISAYDLSQYIIKPQETLITQSIDGEASLEMLIEASLVDSIQSNGFENSTYDYVSHQVIASPFKPLSYIDKIDVFAYRFLENYPGSSKPVDQYLVLELKKGKTNAETVRQLMRYVDWISKEYASGDYSLIKAGVVAKDYVKADIQQVLTSECTRSYISSTHPNTTTIWNDASLYTYDIDENGFVQLAKYDAFDAEKYLREILDSFGWKISAAPIMVDGIKIAPKFKTSKKKLAFFANTNQDYSMLETNGWKVIDLSMLKHKEDVDVLIKRLLE